MLGRHDHCTDLAPIRPSVVNAADLMTGERGPSLVRASAGGHLVNLLDRTTGGHAPGRACLSATPMALRMPRGRDRSGAIGPRPAAETQRDTLGPGPRRRPSPPIARAA